MIWCVEDDACVRHIELYTLGKIRRTGCPRQGTAGAASGAAAPDGLCRNGETCYFRPFS